MTAPRFTPEQREALELACEACMEIAAQLGPSNMLGPQHIEASVMLRAMLAEPEPTIASEVAEGAQEFVASLCRCGEHPAIHCSQCVAKYMHGSVCAQCGTEIAEPERESVFTKEEVETVRRASDASWAKVEEIEKEMRDKDERYVGATFLGLSELADRLAAARKGAKEGKAK